MTKSKNKDSEYLKNVKVMYNNRVLCLTDSTKQRLQIDIWLKTHPFYTKSGNIVDSEGRVEKFIKKYKLNKKNSNLL